MYRLSRSIEASIIDQIQEALVDANWLNIRVEKAFARVYDKSTPCLLIEVTSRPMKTREIGSKKVFPDAEITMRFFAENDGQREDFTDWLIGEDAGLFLDTMDYYSYTIEAGETIIKDLKGKMRFTITQNRKEFLNTWTTDTVEKLDQHRQLIVMQCRVSFLKEC